MVSLLEAEDEDEPIAQINIIPFVDISLVLLIIFLLTANIIAKADIPVELPRAASGNESVGPTVNIVVTADGDLFVDGNATKSETLDGAIRSRFQADSRLRAVIAADKNVRYERVVDVVDAVKRAGVSAFALNIEKVAP